MPRAGSSSSIAFQCDGTNAQSPATDSSTVGFSPIARQTGFGRARCNSTSGFGSSAASTMNCVGTTTGSARRPGAIRWPKPWSRTNAQISSTSRGASHGWTSTVSLSRPDGVASVGFLPALRARLPRITDIRAAASADVDVVGSRPGGAVAVRRVRLRLATTGPRQRLRVVAVDVALALLPVTGHVRDLPLVLTPHSRPDGQAETTQPAAPGGHRPLLPGGKHRRLVG